MVEIFVCSLVDAVALCGQLADDLVHFSYRVEREFIFQVPNPNQIPASTMKTLYNWMKEQRCYWSVKKERKKYVTIRFQEFQHAIEVRSWR